MKQLKKTILTLVALLALTTQAWADAVPVTELKASDINAWIGDNTALTAADLPGFTAVSDEEVVNIPAPLTNGAIFMIYAFNGTNIKFVSYYNGAQVDKGEDYYNRDNIAYNAFDVGSIIYYTGTAPASSGPVVAWNKAEKTGTFTMPGGNVELEPEYYPQAALTAAPTAINDVPATTDGAIVEAGTVANIDGTTTAQGTVMYHVSTTALDDAALLALAADAWTADVPTAQSFTAAGQAYVYYYVRGNDSDTDAEIFSDGDILATNALTVTIAAAPTYAVTFAEGTDLNEWTASPAANVTKGETVTVTYTGTKKVLGVKAEKKSAAGIVNPVVGQIIGSDGKNYDANATLPTGVTAVAKIFYVGSDNGEDAPYNHGLALAMSNANSGNSCSWKTSNTDAGHTNRPGGENFTSESGLQYNAMHNSEIDNYPAFKAAITYSPAAPTGCSAWFLASGYQWKQMITAAGGADKLGLQGTYWSSTEKDDSRAWRCYFTDGYFYASYKGNAYQVRACLAF